MYLIQSVSFGDGFVEVRYMDHPGDIRADGTLMKTTCLVIDTEKGDYSDEREAVEDAVLALLRDALEDYDQPRKLEDLG